MFGSFTPELDEDRPRYGLVKNLGRFNVLWAAFHEWIGIAKDLATAPWRAKLGYAFGPPGWSHDGSRDTSETIREKWAERIGQRGPRSLVPSAVEGRFSESEPTPLDFARDERTLRA
jgi:hypothetical protein